MNILHLGKYYPPYHGGMEHYLKDLASEQVKQNHQVTVLVHNHNHGLLKSKSESETIDGVNVIRQASLRPVLFTPLMLGLVKTIKSLHQQQTIDVIHIHWPNPSACWLLFAQLDIPCLIQWHADMVTEGNSWVMKALHRLASPFEQALIKRCRTIQTSSPAYAEHSQALKPHRSKCHVVPLGIETKTFEPTEQDLKWADELWPEGQLRVFHLGRMTHYKNQKLLIALASQSKQHHTVMAGDGPLSQSLKAQAETLEVKNHVTFTGRLSASQVHALYRSCDVFCLPSDDRAESFGVVLLEAMYHDKILLVADTAGSGMAWLANQYNKGFVFKNNDIQDLMEQLHHIEENMATIKTLCSEFHYPIEKTAQAMSALYQQTIQSTKENEEDIT